MITYSSEFIRSLKNSEASRIVPPEIIRQFQQDEYYNSKQQFDPDQIGVPLNGLMRETSQKTDASKDDISSALRPQGPQRWTKGCGVIHQAKTAEPQGTTLEPINASIKPTQSVNAQHTAIMSSLPGRQPRAFLTNRPAPSALAANSAPMRPAIRPNGEFGQGYASSYKPARDQEFRQSRPYGRGRGMGGRHDDFEGRGPNSYHQNSAFGQGFGGNYGNRSGFGSRRHVNSTGDAVPEWFTDGPADPFALMELGGELPSSDKSSCSEESPYGEGRDIEDSLPVSRTTSNTAEAAKASDDLLHQSNLESNGDKERPASQQADFTYLLWSTLNSDLASSLEDGSHQESAKLEGSKLWSVWNAERSENVSETNPRGIKPGMSHDPSVSGWNDTHASADRIALSNAPQKLGGSQNNHLNNSARSGEAGARGLNPNELFAKFSFGNGAQAPPRRDQAVDSHTESRKSPSSSQPLSLEDLERKLMRKKQDSTKQSDKLIDSDHENNPGQKSNQARPFFDAIPSNQQNKVEDFPSHQHSGTQGGGINPASLQMQLAAAQQAIMNAVAAANTAGSGSSSSAAALQQQKMLFANLMQHQQQLSQQSSGNSNGNSGNVANSQHSLPPGLPPFLNMFPPNALAAAAAAAASSPMFLYPQLLQQAQAQSSSARLPGASGANPAMPPTSQGSGNMPNRPPFPMPSPAAFQNLPALNPAAAANLMAAALSHFQQQQQQQQHQTGKSSPGALANGQPSVVPPPAAFSNPNVAAAAAAAATALMAGRMGMNPNMVFPNSGQFNAPPNSGAPQPQKSSNAQHSLPQNNSASSMPGSNSYGQLPPQHQQQQQQQQLQQHQAQQNRRQAGSPPQPRQHSPARQNIQSSHQSQVNNMSSSKLGASFIPTQVMMKNPHAAGTPGGDVNNAAGNKNFQPAQLNRSGSNPLKKVAENPPISYSSVAGNNNASLPGANANSSSAPQGKILTAEDLERSFKVNYSAYPPLNHQAGGSNNQRTAGVVSGSSSQNAGRMAGQNAAPQPAENAHQFSVADLLRGAAVANKTPQSSSAGFS